MTDTSSCSVPDNTVYTGYLTANPSSEKTFLLFQPSKKAITKMIQWKIQKNGTEFQNSKGLIIYPWTTIISSGEISVGDEATVGVLFRPQDYSFG